MVFNFDRVLHFILIISVPHVLYTFRFLRFISVFALIYVISPRLNVEVATLHFTFDSVLHHCCLVLRFSSFVEDFERGRMA